MKTLAVAAVTMVAQDGSSEVSKAAREDGRATFESILRQYERLVFSTALRLLGEREDARDAAQEVFLRLYRNLNRLEAQASPASWLYRVTVNVCHDLRRRRPVMAPVEELESSPDPAPGPLESARAEERRRALNRGLRFLSEREREAIVLRDLEGLSTEEVARAMGTSEATVRSQACQGRVKMRRFLERYLGRRS